MNFKLKKVDETEKVKQWCIMVVDEQLANVKLEVRKMNSEIIDEHLRFKSLFNLPGLVGGNNKYPNFKEYFLDYIDNNKRKFKSLKLKFEELE